jgi:hypothetical protein
MIFVIFCVNFVISWFNAWGCGATWDSTKAKGGMAHFMNWMGAIMSASGFTWCYLVIVGFIGANVPAQWFAEEGEVVAGMLLDPSMLQAFYDLGYIVIIFPILGSGLAITVASWRSFARRRTVGDGLVAGWNTFAQVHNTYSAIRHIPGVFDRLGGFFGGSSSSSSSDDSKGTIVILLVAVAVLGGVLTTYGILQSKRRAVILDSAMRV